MQPGATAGVTAGNTSFIMKSNLSLLLVAVVALSGVVAAFADLAKSPAELRASLFRTDSAESLPIGVALVSYVDGQ